MRRFFAVLVVVLSLTAMAVPAGTAAPRAPAAATFGLCTAHFTAIPAPGTNRGVDIAHMAVPEPSTACP
jgi:hypothetical protein